MSTAFELSGGGRLAAVQVGMLPALAERGTRPDLLVGTSAGPLGRLLAAQPPHQRLQYAAMSLHGQWPPAGPVPGPAPQGARRGH